MNPATEHHVEANKPQILAGRTLKMAREAHRVGLRELAALVGVSAGHLSRIESGIRPASPDLHERICDVLASLPAPERAS